MNKVGNIQHSTFNIQRPTWRGMASRWMLSVECLLAIYRSWELNVFHFQAGGLS